MDCILESCGRNTAPAIALYCLALDPEETVFVVSSDHLIRDEIAYRKAMAKDREAAAQGFLVIFGLRPEYPETGYGYIEAGPGSEDGIQRVKAFKEKPDCATAEFYIAAGRFFWNSGMFCFKAKVFLEELGRGAPEILTASRKAYTSAERSIGADGGNILNVAEPVMEAIPVNSIDYAVMEKERRLRRPLLHRLEWRDLGSWVSIYAARDKDEPETASTMDTYSRDSRNNLVLGSGRPIAPIGVDDLIVVDSGGATLVAKRGESQRVKEVVELLGQRGNAKNTRCCQL
jgi:mannose-1-phosphate guanylyltransferase